MGRLRHKRMHKNIKDLTKKHKTKRRTKDLDQIHESLLPARVALAEAAAPDGDLPGLGQHYCFHCTKHFVDTQALGVHLKSKIHKRRVKELQDQPFSQEEAEAAAGMGSYLPRQKMNVPKIIGAAAHLAIQHLANE